MNNYLAAIAFIAALAMVPMLRGWNAARIRRKRYVMGCNPFVGDRRAILIRARYVHMENVVDDWWWVIVIEHTYADAMGQKKRDLTYGQMCKGLGSDLWVPTQELVLDAMPNWWHALKGMLIMDGVMRVPAPSVEKLEPVVDEG